MTTLKERFEEHIKLPKAEVRMTDIAVPSSVILTFIKQELMLLAEIIEQNSQMRVPDKEISASIIRTRADEI